MTHTQPDKVFGRHNGDVATDSYNRYKEDVQLMREAGVSIPSREVNRNLYLIKMIIIELIDFWSALYIQYNLFQSFKRFFL